MVCPVFGCFIELPTKTVLFYYYRMYGGFGYSEMLRGGADGVARFDDILRLSRYSLRNVIVHKVTPHKKSNLIIFMRKCRILCRILPKIKAAQRRLFKYYQRFDRQYFSRRQPIIFYRSFSTILFLAFCRRRLTHRRPSPLWV